MKTTMKGKRLVKKSAFTALAMLVALILIYPLILTFTNSFMQESQVQNNYFSYLTGEFSQLSLIPEFVTLRQYYDIFMGDPQYLQMFWNSVKLVIPIVILQVVISSLAAFGFSKLEFKGRNKIFFVYIIVMLMPFQVTVVANYIMADTFQILDTYWSIILPGAFQVMGTFLMRQFMLYLPNEYIESAKIEGAGYLQIFRRIVLPLSKTGLWVLIVLTLIDNWNMVEQPLIFLNDQSTWPMSIYLSGVLSDQLGTAFAASFLYMVFPLLIFWHADSYMIEGIHLAGLKG